jgi:hypothetical protein
VVWGQKVCKGWAWFRGVNCYLCNVVRVLRKESGDGDGRKLFRALWLGRDVET